MTKEQKTTNEEKRRLQQMVLEQLGIHRQNKKRNLDTNLTPFQITVLVKHKTINILGDNTGENLEDLGFGNDFSEKSKA